MNRVVHFELPVDDLERAKKFYADIFGWQLIAVPEMNYVIIRTVEVDANNTPLEVGAINGGFYARADGGSPHPVPVIAVENIAEHCRKVEQAGGSIFLPKRQIGDMGFYAQVKDLEGNIIGLWENVKKE